MIRYTPWLSQEPSLPCGPPSSQMLAMPLWPGLRLRTLVDTGVWHIVPVVREPSRGTCATSANSPSALPRSVGVTVPAFAGSVLGCRAHMDRRMAPWLQRGFPWETLHISLPPWQS